MTCVKHQGGSKETEVWGVDDSLPVGLTSKRIGLLQLIRWDTRKHRACKQAQGLIHEAGLGC